MNAEKILKKSFIGGFKKKDVIDYVEKLQGENSNLVKNLESNKIERDKIELFENENAELKAVVEALTEERNSFETELRNVKTENISLLEQNAELSLKIEEMSGIITDKDDRLIALYNEKDEEVSALKSKCAELESSIEIANQDKANTLIHDAIAYSDKLVSAARETAEKYVSEVESDVSNAVEQVTKANERLKTARVNFDYSLDSIKDNLDSLINALDELKKEFTIGD